MANNLFILQNLSQIKGCLLKISRGDKQPIVVKYSAAVV